MALTTIGSRQWGDSVHPYLSGQRIPYSGIYCVRHGSHRSAHDVTMVQGGFFPACRACGHQVRFFPVLTADRLREDYDFSHRFAAKAG